MTQAYFNDTLKKKLGVSVHQLARYLLTPCLLFHQLLQIWRIQNKQKMILLAQN